MYKGLNCHGCGVPELPYVVYMRSSLFAIFYLQLMFSVVSFYLSTVYSKSNSGVRTIVMLWVKRFPQKKEISNVRVWLTEVFNRSCEPQPGSRVRVSANWRLHSPFIVAWENSYLTWRLCSRCYLEMLATYLGPYSKEKHRPCILILTLCCLNQYQFHYRHAIMELFPSQRRYKFDMRRRRLSRY